LKVLRNISGKLPIVIIIAVVGTLVLGGGAFAFFNKGKIAKMLKGKHTKKIELTNWPMEEFTVNLGDLDQSRYLQVTMSLEVEGGKKKGGEGKGEDPEAAKARDVIISVLSKRKYSDLLSEKGKTKLKEELKASLNEVLEERKVKNIYFTSFAMQ
jgi:flagellar protein FliL